MKKLLFLSCLLSLPYLSIAADCEPFDLRTNQGSMSEVIISQQDENMGTCYANAVSMANDAWTYSHNGPSSQDEILRTSYLALASEFGMDKNRKLRRGSGSSSSFYFESGGIESLLNLMLVKREYCTTKNGKSLLEELTSEKMIKDLVALGGMYSTYSKSLDSGLDTIEELEKKEDFKKMINSLTPSNKEKLYNILREVIGSKEKVNGQDFIHKFIVNSCDKMKDLNWHKFQAIGFEDVLEQNHRTELKSSFIDFFSKKENSQPLIISFCKNAIKNRRTSLDAKLEARGPAPSNSEFEKYCGPHASLIVGRKMDSGSCKLIVRDNMACDPESAELMNGKCDGQDFAIDQDYFNTYIMSINVITE